MISRLKRKLQLLKAEALAQLDSNKAVISIYETLSEDGYELKVPELCQLVESYLQLNDVNKALSVHAMIAPQLETKTDSLYYDLVTSKLLYACGDSHKAYQSALKWGNDIMKDGDTRLSHPENLMLTDYMSLKAESELAHRKYLSSILVLVVIIGVLAIGLLMLTSMVLRQRSIRRKAEVEAGHREISTLKADKARIEEISADMRSRLEEQNENIQQLIAELAGLQLSLDSSTEASTKEKQILLNQIDQNLISFQRQSSELKETRQTVDLLGESLTSMSAQYSSVMEQVVKTLFDFANRPKSLKRKTAEDTEREFDRYRAKIQEVLSQLNDPEKIEQRVASFDKLNGGLMAKFIKDYPSISPRMLMLIKCRYLHLSHPLIMLILNYKDKQSYYRDRNRLKKDLSLRSPDIEGRLSELHF